MFAAIDTALILMHTDYQRSWTLMAYTMPAEGVSMQTVVKLVCNLFEFNSLKVRLCRRTIFKHNLLSGRDMFRVGVRLTFNCFFNIVVSRSFFSNTRIITTFSNTLLTLSYVQLFIIDSQHFSICLVAIGRLFQMLRIYQYNRVSSLSFLSCLLS